jgi:hypothetical protein
MLDMEAESGRSTARKACAFGSNVLAGAGENNYH